MVQIIALISGLLFGLGLAIAQMTNPTKILNFLDITGQWDASLLVVFAAAVGITATGFHYILKKQNPVFASQFNLPAKEKIDVRLIMGAVIFGIGWGIGGYCPGPSLSALAIGWVEPPIFVVAMIVGSLVCGWLFNE